MKEKAKNDKVIYIYIYILYYGCKETAEKQCGIEWMVKSSKFKISLRGFKFYLNYYPHVSLRFDLLISEMELK